MSRMRIWIQPNLIYPIVTSKLYLMWRRWILSALARERERERGREREVQSDELLRRGINHSPDSIRPISTIPGLKVLIYLFVYRLIMVCIFLRVCFIGSSDEESARKLIYYIDFIIDAILMIIDCFGGDEIINLMNILLISVDSPLTVCVGIGLPTKNIEKKNHQSIKIYISDSRRESSW